MDTIKSRNSRETEGPELVPLWWESADGHGRGVHTETKGISNTSSFLMVI